MTWSNKLSHTTILYKNLKLENLMIYDELKLAKFMHQIFCQKLPQTFGVCLPKLKEFIPILQDSKASLNTFFRRLT